MDVVDVDSGAPVEVSPRRILQCRVEAPAPHHGNGDVAEDLPRLPSTFVEAIELWRASTLAVELFGADVHHHVLTHAEHEWRAFNSTVTDWECTAASSGSELR